MATCVFCRCEEKLTKEHVFPEWVRPYLQHPAGKGTHQHIEIRASGTTMAGRG